MSNSNINTSKEVTVTVNFTQCLSKHSGVVEVITARGSRKASAKSIVASCPTIAAVVLESNIDLFDTMTTISKNVVVTIAELVSFAQLDNDVLVASNKKVDFK